MADPNSAEFAKPAPTPDQPKPARGWRSRRSVISGLAGLVGIMLAGRNPEPAAAETQPPSNDKKPPSQQGKFTGLSEVFPSPPAPVGKPENLPDLDPEAPEEFKKIFLEKGKQFRKFLEPDKEVKILFQTGKVLEVNSSYKQDPNHSKLSLARLYVRFSDKDKKPWKQVLLEFGKKYSEVIDANQGNSLSDAFATGVLEYAGIDLNKLVAGESGEVAKLAIFRPFLEFGSYTNTAETDSLFGSVKDIKKEMFGRVLSILLVDPAGFAKKLDDAPPEIKPVVAHIFLKGLKEALEAVPLGATFDSLGLNREVLNKTLAANRDWRLKEYFDEKIEFMGKPLSNKGERPILPKAT